MGRLSRVVRVGADALFVYGTLQFPEVLTALIGRVPEREAVGAEGWRVAALPGRPYPGIVPGDTIVRGYLITGLDAEEWRLLDAFEGPGYELVRIELTDGRCGWAYVWPSEAGDGDWSAEEFEAHELAVYAVQCLEWRRGFEAT
ncbi:gamma-glutamylcyclotransferase family protein [Actinomadura rifamycini]|uniref:gamma-glutamylcyclotransferase family protein n=1 Tax=Actinomadura rifamycini TaxID=31962 RepID=UPI003133AA87